MLVFGLGPKTRMFIMFRSLLRQDANVGKCFTLVIHSSAAIAQA